MLLSTGSSNRRLINWNNSTIWVSNKLGVQVEGARISIARGIGSRSSSIGNSWSSCNYWGLGSIDSSLGGKMLSTGSSNSRLINRGDSTIGVSNQSRESSKGGSISIGGSIGSRNSSVAKGGSSSKRGSSCNSYRSRSKLSDEVLSPGSSHSRLINRSHSSVGVANKAKESLGRADRQRSSKNQKLHDYTCLCARAQILTP